jgi:CARDB
MKHLTIVCLAALAVASLARPADAGRRTRRAVRRTAVVAAAVVAAPRRTTVVAAAPVVVARRNPTVAALPDLTITELAVQRDALVITVANIGRAASPLTRLDATLRRQSDGLSLGAQSLRVLPLAAGQSVRISLRSVPLDDVHFACAVDPLQEVAEMSELNNSNSLAIAPLPTPPQVLQDEAQWQPPTVQDAEPIVPGRNP